MRSHDENQTTTRRSSTSGHKRPSIVQVAALAGVSHITVSRVMNGNGNVRPETRNRILAAMRELGYQPNSAARVLVTGKSRVIGVVCYNTALYGPAAALQGLEQAAGEQGYFVTMICLKSLDQQAISDAAARLRQQSVAGLVLVSPHTIMTAAFERLPKDLPTVAIWGYPGAGIPVVASCEEAGAQQATRHLLDLGHQTVWHVAGPLGRTGAEGRLRGWRETLKAAGIDPPPQLTGDWSARSGYEAGKKLAAESNITAVFVGNDQMALGVLRALNEAGRRVPQDVSVVGFDDIPDAAYYLPPLTTIRQDFAELGRRSLKLLLCLMDEQSPVDNIVLPTDLIIRESTATTT